MGEKCRFYVDIIAQHPEVTGSCFLLVIKIPGEKKSIKGIVDCGLFKERRYEDLNQIVVQIFIVLKILLSLCLKL